MKGGQHIHIWRAESQPATCWRLPFDDKSPMMRNSPNKQLRCFTCGRLRYARNLIVHAYYDGTYYFCRAGTGCKRKEGPTKKERRSRKP